MANSAQIETLQASATYQVIHEHQRKRWVQALTQKDPAEYAELEDDETFKDLAHAKRRVALYGLRYECLYQVYRYHYHRQLQDGKPIFKNCSLKCIYHGQ
jgi:hypothetical protein